MIVLEVAVAFVALYPVVTAGLWAAGGLVYRWSEEDPRGAAPDGGWPAVTVLIPAYNEAAVVGPCVRAALAADYPHLHVTVLDDGSADDTARVARDAGAGDPRLTVVRDPVNRGKAGRLNRGFQDARDDLVIVTDADTHLHPAAVKLLVRRLLRSPRNAAVAGAPHVTNRDGLLCAMQVLEASAIIGLIRRTQSLSGAVGTVAGVLALYRRADVLAVGGFDGRMATEDIDLSWRLLLAGRHTVYEPNALVGMQVPSTLGALWAQRQRWARGQGEALHEHLGDLLRWRHRRLWPLAAEAVASLLWINVLVASLVVTVVVVLVTDRSLGMLGFSLAWGIAIAVVATLQLVIALEIDYRHDRRAPIAALIAPLYTIGFWMVSGGAALHRQTAALLRGPPERHVSWDIPREQLMP